MLKQIDQKMTARSSVTQGQPAIHTGELSSERLRRPPRDCQLLAAGSTMNTNTQQYERYKHTKQDATKTRRNQNMTQPIPKCALIHMFCTFQFLEALSGPDTLALMCGVPVPPAMLQDGVAWFVFR